MTAAFRIVIVEGGPELRESANSVNGFEFLSVMRRRFPTIPVRHGEYEPPQSLERAAKHASELAYVSFCLGQCRGGSSEVRLRALGGCIGGRSYSGDAQPGAGGSDDHGAGGQQRGRDAAGVSGAQAIGRS